MMVGKLAAVALTTRSANRDEIRQVIVDTVILMESDDPSATLDEWMDG